MKNDHEREFIDEKVLFELRELEKDGAADLVTSVIQIFVETAPKDIQEINTAISESDSELLLKIAHRFKSSCFSLGAITMGEAAERLEALGKTNTTQGAEQDARYLVETLPKVIARFIQFIEKNYGK